MYHELAVLARHVARDRTFWKDGEIWTAVVGGLATGVWLYVRPEFVIKMREHFDDLTNVTSITFGFALTALFFHVEAIGTWRRHRAVQQVAERLITSHIWTIACLLIQLGYILALWAIDFNVITLWPSGRSLAYGTLTFLAIYCGCQILNHALTAWWAFIRRDILANPEKGRVRSESHVSVREP